MVSTSTSTSTSSLRGTQSATSITKTATSISSSTAGTARTTPPTRTGGSSNLSCSCSTASSVSRRSSNNDPHDPHAELTHEFGFVEKELRTKLCSFPIYCPTAEGVVNKENTAIHKASCMHVCKYGKSCRDIKDPKHLMFFVHLDKPTCAAGSRCSNTDPQHRSDYHHPGSWDYLIPCLRIGCTDRSYAHCSRYQHETKTYPLLKKKK